MDYGNVQTDYSQSLHDFFWGTWDNVANAAQGWYHYVGAVLAGIVILSIGFIIAALVRTVIVWVLGELQVKRYAKQIRADRLFRVNLDYDWGRLLGDLAWWFVTVTFLLAALDATGLKSYFIVDRFLDFVPTAFFAGVVVLAGWIFAGLVSRVAMGVAGWLSAGSEAFVGGAVRAGFYVLTAVFALQVFDVESRWIDALIAAGIVAVALAAGIGFGLGGGYNRATPAGGLLERWGSLWPKRDERRRR